MMSINPFRRMTALVLVLSLALSLTACGGTQAGTPAGSDTGADASASPSDNPGTVSIEEGAEVPEGYERIYLVSKKTSYNEDGEFSRSVTYSYDANGNRIEESVWDVNGAYLFGKRYEYNDQNLMTLYQALDENQNILKETSSTYDEQGQLTEAKTTDAENRIEERQLYQYDSNGNQTLSEFYGQDDFLDYRVESVYDADGNMISRIDSMFYRNNDGSYLSSSTYFYDDAHNLMKTETILDIDGTTQNIVKEYEYDEKGNQVSFWSYEDGKLAQRCVSTYDDMGNMTGSASYAGENETPYESIENEYDQNGHLTRTVNRDAAGEQSSAAAYEYDENGNEILYCTYNEDKEEVYRTESTYNEAGSVLSTTDYIDCSFWSETTNVYDEQERLISSEKLNEEGLISSTTECFYDENGNMVSYYKYNGSGNKTEESYDTEWISIVLPEGVYVPPLDLPDDADDAPDEEMDDGSEEDFSAE